MSDSQPTDTLNTNTSEPRLPTPASQQPNVSPLMVAALVMPTAETSGLDLRGYELIEPLGKGGMGEVYRATDPALGRELAIKVMKEHYRDAPQAEQRFVREARITGSLQHPSIVPIHNLGRLSDGRLHYTMRLVRGRTFSDILTDEGGRPERWPELLTIYVKICQAVAYAHSKGVIHRDLKPHNVMVGSFGEVQVMDWGLAKLLTPGERGRVSAPSVANTRGADATPLRGERGCVSAPSAVDPSAPTLGTSTQGVQTQPSSPVADDALSDLTQMGGAMGTPAYMPPEQALGEWDRVDERADVFALGAILCEILTGAPPYTDLLREAVFDRAKRGDTAAALERLQQCGADAALTDLCRECLTAQREGRPRDAGVAARRVADYQAEVQARLQRAEVERTRALVKAQEERKRRRTALVLMGLIFIAAVIGVWQAVRATQAERKALGERDEKETALTLAKNRLAQIEKSNEALASIFRELDPRAETKGGPDLRQQLSQHLHRAASQLDEISKDDPVTAAQLQTTLGQSLINLGQAERAIELLRKAGATLEAQLGPDHAETLRNSDALATAYKEAGQVDKALPLYQQTLAKRKATLGEDHSDTLTSANNLASAYEYAGQLDKALPLYEQTLAKQRSKFGDDRSETLTTMNNLALAYQSAGRLDKALPLLQETLTKMKGKYGPDHLDTLTAMNNLASAYHSAGQSSKALPILQETLTKTKAVLGEDHPLTLRSISNLAGAYHSTAQWDKAIPLYELALAKKKAKLGADHPDTLSTMINLALEYGVVGRWDKALPLHEQTLAKAKAKLGADHPETLVSMNGLAHAYKDAGQLDKAIPLFQQTLAKMKAKLGEDHPSTLNTLNGLAGAYYSAGKLDKALPLLEQTLAKRKAKLGLGHPDTLISINNLATVYKDTGRLDKALPLYEQSLAAMQAKLGDDHPDTLVSAYNLAVAYLVAMKLDKATALFEQTLAKQKSKLGVNHLSTLNTMAGLGITYREAGRLTEAISLLETALERGQQFPRGLPVSLVPVPGNLAETYDRAGQFAKAETIYRDFLRQAEKQLGRDDLRTAAVMAKLGDNLLKQKKYPDAASTLRQCLTVREKKQPDDWTTFNTRSSLGEALAGQKKYAEAEPLLVKGYEGMKQRQDKIPPLYRSLRLRQAIERLVHLYEGWGKTDKAEPWRKKLAEMKPHSVSSPRKIEP